MLSHRMAAMAYSSTAMSKACMGGIANRAGLDELVWQPECSLPANRAKHGGAVVVLRSSQESAAAYPQAACTAHAQHAQRSPAGCGCTAGAAPCRQHTQHAGMHSMHSAHRPVVAVQRVLPPQAPPLRRAGGPQLLRKALRCSLLPHPADIG